MAQALGGAAGGAPAGLGLQAQGELGVEVEPDDRRGEHKADDNCGDQRDGGEAAVERDRRPERQLPGSQGAEQADAAGAEQKPEAAAGQREQRGFRDDFSGDMTASGAEGLADGEFLRAAACANQQQVGEVDRADEQQKQHTALEENQDWLDCAHMVLVQRADRGMVAGALDDFGEGIIGCLVDVEGVDLRLGVGERRARSEPGDHVPAVVVAAVGLDILRGVS